MTRECQQTRDLMDSYLAGELLVETNHEILRHLGGCADCTGELERRRRARTLLKEALASDVDAGALHGRIHAAIAGDRPWYRFARRGAVAAALVAAIILAYGRFGGLLQAAPTYRDVVVDHIECALTFPATATYDAASARRRLKPPFADLPGALPARQGDYQLVDAHTCPYKGRRYAHLVYRDAAHVVSLFADPGAGAPLPSSDLLVPGSVSAPMILGARYRGYEVAALATRSHQVLVVSDLARDGNLRVARDLFPAIVTFVEQLER